MHVTDRSLAADTDSPLADEGSSLADEGNHRCYKLGYLFIEEAACSTPMPYMCKTLAVGMCVLRLLPAAATPLVTQLTS